MSVTQTFTVTVVGGNPANHPYHDFGSSNKYAIDGSTATADVTLSLVEGGTYRFDQSDSSNSGHPLRFSTTENGTHSSGSEYTTGVTTNGTPGSSGAYTEITVADGAPTLYYYCTNHSGMGWTANTDVVPTSFTVTVVSTDSGNKYVIDGVQQDTLYFSKTGSYRFDQSDSSNNNHPLRLSQTENGTHSGGSEYTTGVNTVGTPGNSGAYTQITVASNAPDSLYYYCSNHSLMGGSIFIGVSTWGENTWGSNSWQSGVSLATLTGVSSTASLGTVDAFPEQGWGSDTWGFENWGESSIDVTVSGVAGTTSIGSVTVTAEINTGWGRAAWNDDAWGIQGDILLEGVSATASVGSLVVGDILGLTGQSATASIGSPTIVGDITQSLTGVSATSSVGSISPADVMGLTGQSATSSVGSISPADVIGVSGVSATTTVNAAGTNITSNPTILPTGLSVTASVGTISPADVIGLTGVSATVNVGTLTPADVMGLTGVEATTSVAELGTSDKFGIQAYQAIDTGSNTSYTDVAA